MESLDGDHKQGSSSWLLFLAAALLGAASVAISALWMHRRVVERLIEQKKLIEGENVDKARRGKLKKPPLLGKRGYSMPPHKDVRQAGPVEVWWSCNEDKLSQSTQTTCGDVKQEKEAAQEAPQAQQQSCGESGEKVQADQSGKCGDSLAEAGKINGVDGLKGAENGRGSSENGRVSVSSRSRSKSPDREQDDDHKLQLPQGLSKVRTRIEGSAHSASNRRNAHLGTVLMRPATPKSPSNSGLFDMDGSDDDLDMGTETEKDMLDNICVIEEPVANECFEDSLLRLDGEVKASLLPHSSSLECLVASLENEKSETLSARPHSLADELLGAPDPVAADILRKEPQQETFVRMKVTPYDPPTVEEEEVCLMLQQCLALREKYLFVEMAPPWRKGEHDSYASEFNPDPFHYEPETRSQHVFRMEDGVVRVYANEEAKEELFPVPDATAFFTDMHRILRITGLGNVRTFCYHRLHLLEQKFSLHLMLNADREFLAQKSAPHRDFYNVRKVDTHVHHSSCMNQKHLLRFIKSKLRNEPDEVVIFRDGQYLTLKEVFESLDLTGYDLNVDLLDVHADKNTFHRFDKFNLKYNPCGQSRLREIFLKQDNLIQGRFLAELTKEVFQDLAVSKYQMAEYRISVYGRKQSEWDQLASWIVNNELYSENVVWLIQVPRLYIFYKKMGIVTSFQTILDNLFLPLFEVTVDPGSHPQLHIFLKQVVGFDMVDDESKPERRPNKHMQTPLQWDINFNPAYSYWAYYIYANMHSLNKLRESKGLCTIKFRPHSGEAGDLDHLASTFLLAHNIAHGNNLRKSPGLQYLYYLSQIGLAMSPLSNNSLFLDYHRNPFPMFFSRGLNVSLSTDDPLQIHLTKEPLVEEYSIAAQVWKLSSCDLCEIARNSVYQSGFPHSMKLHWIGHKYFKRGAAGNDIHKTNVPHMRVEFRYESWQEELQYICLGGARLSEEIDP